MVFPRALTRLSYPLMMMALSLAAGGPATAQEVSFAGKRVNALIGATPGGGTDLSTRLVGRFLEKHLPGGPQIVYRNMPAANGVAATNYFANEATRDGTYWIGGGNAYIDAQVLRQSIVKYDPRNFHFFGGIARGGSVMTVRDEAYAALTDRSRPAIVIGTGDGTDTWAEMMCWGAEVLGWNLRFVVGYPGTAAILLAMQRGEVDSVGTSNLTMLDGLRKRGGFKEFVQIGEMRDGKIAPRSYAPDVPTIASLIEDSLTGVAKEAFPYWTNTNQIDKWFAVPPGTPEPVVATYRAAFERAFADPELLKIGRATISPDFRHQNGDEITQLVRETAYPSAEITVYLHDLRVKHGLPGAPLSKEELDRLAAKLVGEGNKATSPLSEVQNGGRVVVFKADGKDHKGNVSSSNTKVTIAGASATRGDLKPGMACEIAYNGDEVTAITCK